MIIATVDRFAFPAIQYSGTQGKREYRLLDDFRFEWFENGHWYRRTVFKVNPACQCEAETDLASVPDNPLGFEQAGCTDSGAVVHDNGYERLGVFLPGEFQVQTPTGEWIDCKERVTRLRCDLLFFKMIRLGGFPLHKAVVEFLSLRVGALSRRNGVKWYLS